MLRFLENGIRLLFLVLLGLALVHSVHFSLTSVTKAWTLGLIILLGGSIYWCFRSGARIKGRFYWFVGASLLVFLWQGWWFMQTITPIGFDVGVVYERAAHLVGADYGYFSANPNNLSLFFFSEKWMRLFGNTFPVMASSSWLAVDATVVMLLLTARKLCPRALYPTWALSLGWLSLFPYINVPYTDTLCLPFVGLIWLGYAYYRVPGHLGFLAALGLGLGVSGAYLFKPSAMIPVIAILIVALLWRQGDWLWRRIGLTVAAVIAVTGSFQIYTQSQSQRLHLDLDQRKPPAHFIAMGLADNGGFHRLDTDTIVVAPNYAARQAMAQSRIRYRLADFGPVGLLQHLWQKHQHNTADGSFAWLGEGGFIRAKPKNLWQHCLYPSGRYLPWFQSLAQVFWVLLLSTVLLSIKRGRRLQLTLQLAVVGALVFLLIFEAGRSRYLIQFLPTFLLLGGVNLAYLRQFVFNAEK